MKLTILSVCLLAFIFTFSTQTFAVDFGVNLTSDQHDAELGDGFCDIFTNVAGAQCTLRAAVEQANALASNDRIFFLLPNNSIVTLTTANGGVIPITSNGTLQIIGMGANNLTINGGTGTNRIFYADNAAVLISGLTLTGGNSSGIPATPSGGAVLAKGGSMTLERVHVTGNSATTNGGGVFFDDGTHEITGSTFSANSAFNCGGFINSGGTLTVLNSSISGNSAANVGGGFCNVNSGAALLRNVTIIKNTADGAGGFTNQGTLNFGNTIVAGNNAINSYYPEFDYANGTITSAGGNLVGDEPGDSTNTGKAVIYQSSDQQNVNPMLGSLQNNGGPTPTHALLPGSPAIDNGLDFLATSAELSTDQRGTGFARIRDGNGDGTATVDIGAFEVQSAPPAVVNFTVNVTSDQHDPNLGDGLCGDVSPAPGIQCSLRAAIEQANALAGNNRILFDLPANSTITLTAANGEIPIINNGVLQITGTGANNLTIDGGTGTNRIFYTNSATVFILDVTLTGGGGAGASNSGNGGAIYADNGSLTLERVHVTANSATNSAGGVYFLNGNHQVIGSTFSANTALACGALSNVIGTLTVLNSTISGNTTTSGSNFCNGSGGNATLRNVTITNNTGSGAGGITQGSGTLNFGNTIVAGNIDTDNSGGDEILYNTGTITSAGGNLVGDEPGDSTAMGLLDIAYQPSDILDTPPMLGPLQNNGGPTPTHALLFGSPAIDSGLNTLANGAVLTTDQRGTGFARFRDGNGDNLAFVDIGSFEAQTTVTTAASVSVSGRVFASKGRGVAGAVVHLINQNGEIQIVRTNRSGAYNFENLEAGETYIFNVYSKRHQFNSQVITLTEDLAELNFTAQ